MAKERLKADEEADLLTTLRLIRADIPEDIKSAILSSSVSALRAYKHGELPFFKDAAKSIRDDVAAAHPGSWHVIGWF